MDYAKLSDAMIVTRVLHGDGDAYATLVTRYKGLVASAVYELIPHLKAVDEVTLDAFARAWRKLDRLKEHQAFGGWVRQIARRLALTRIRNEKRERQRLRREPERVGAANESGPVPAARASVLDVENLPTEKREDPCEQLARKQLYELIAREISRLPGAYRRALGLRYFHGLSCKEIASALGIPIGTATMQLSRGNRLLRARLKPTLRDYLEG